MTSPPNFYLQSVNISERPTSCPPRRMKTQIYTQPEIFKTIDDHAIQEARTNYRNFKDIVWNLIYKKQFNELQRARAIFRWMTSKNFYTIMFDSELPGSPEYLLSSFKDGKTTMAKMFECLASFSGLHCVTISGWAKGVEYKPGTQITSTPANHSWNAVFIDGSWQLVDSHWATRYLQSDRNTLENLVYEYDDFYFLTEPSVLIYSHCPQDVTWQLLTPARTRAEYEDYPLVKSFFFSSRMQFLQQNKGVVYTKRGIVTLTLGVAQPTSFMFKLCSAESGLEKMHGLLLKNYVIQETTDTRVTFYFRSPREGSYYLTVFAQPIYDHSVMDNIFKATCEYKIVCNEAARDLPPFPLCSDANWGAAAPLRQYGLVPSQKTFLLAAPSGLAELSLVHPRNVRLFARLVKDGVSEKAIENSVSLRDKDDRIVVEVKLPTPGEYGLELYANDPTRDGDTYSHVCQYLVTFTDQDSATLYGQVFDRPDLGQNMRATSLLYTAPATESTQGYRPAGNQLNRPLIGGVSARPEAQNGQLSGGRIISGDGDLRKAYVVQSMGSPYAGVTATVAKPEKREYESFSQDWDGNTMSEKSYKEKVESSGDGSTSYSHRTTQQMTSKMETVGLFDKPISAQHNSALRAEERITASETLPPSFLSTQMNDSSLPQKSRQQEQINNTQQPQQQQQPESSQKRIPVVYELRPDAGTVTNAFKSQQVIPIHCVPYAFGGDRVDDGFISSIPTEPEIEYKPHSNTVYTSSITVHPPLSFRAIPIQQQEPSAPQPAPPVVPPKPFKDTVVFENVDTHAVQVSKEEHESFRDLVWHLIYARQITNELEKARAIFLWLCSMDLAKLNFSDIQKGSPEEILTNLQRGQTTYAVVFEILCSYAGLHCKSISGYAKGADYKPGMSFTGDQGQHSWNAVMVNGAWRLVDCHWAARRLVGKMVTAENVRYELDEYYFMPDPHQLIFTHFPDDINWQLLERSITLTDFENLVPVKSAFFKYGLQILGHREAVIHTKHEVTIRIGCPAFKAKSLAFTFTVTFEDGREDFNGIKLNRFGMQEMIENVSFFTVRPPTMGRFRLIIYAKDLDRATKEGFYGGVCEYEIVCEATPASPQPFPPCVHTSWGPGDSAHKYGLTPLQTGAIFSTVNGLAEVRFQIPPRDLRFTAKLKSNGKDDKALAGFVMHRVVGNLAIFTVRAPSRGEFGLEIYANDVETDGNSLFHAYQYLIICADMITGPVDELPVLPSGYLGPQPTFKSLGLNICSHPDPYIQTDVGELQVSFSLTNPLRVTSQLIYVGRGQSEDVSDFVLQQSQGASVVIFFVKLPRTGLYKLQIYALPISDLSENLPGVFNYLLHCSNTQATGVPYPKQYGQWKEGCYLHAPLNGQLTRNKSTHDNTSTFHFKVDVPNAKAVAVVAGEDWTQLDQEGSTWTGGMNLDKHFNNESKLALCANFGTSEASYSTLLEYAIKA